MSSLVVSRLFYIVIFMSDVMDPRPHVQAAHIVAISSVAVSPTRALAKIGYNLAMRGHSFTILVPSYNDFLQFPKEIKVVFYSTPLTTDALGATFDGELKEGLFTRILGQMYCFRLLKTTCEVLLKNEDLLSSLGKVDIVLCDIWSMCGPIVAGKLQVPRIDLSTPGFADPTLAFLHNFPVSLNHVLTRKMVNSIFYRTIKVLEYGLVYVLVYKYAILGSFEPLWSTHVNGSKFDSYETLVRSTGLVLVQTDFAIDFPRPLGPHVKVIGAIMAEPAGKLSKELDDFINGGQNKKLVVVSFGTFPLKIKQSFVETIASALAKLPARVLWKHKGQLPSSLGENTKILPWIPQNDLLGHTSTKAFVTHAGMHSTLEAVYHGVPMVAIPLFSDQHANAAKIAEFGVGIVLDKFTMTEESIRDAIIRAMGNTSMRENVGRVSRIMRSRPIPPVELAVQWVEYGLQTNGASHLRNKADSFLWYNLYFLDVIFLILGAAVFSIGGLFLTSKCFYNICQRLCKSKVD